MSLMIRCSSLFFLLFLYVVVGDIFVSFPFHSFSFAFLLFFFFCSLSLFFVILSLLLFLLVFFFFLSFPFFLYPKSGGPLTLFPMGYLKGFLSSHTQMKTTRENTLLVYSTSIFEVVNVYRIKS